MIPVWLLIVPDAGFIYNIVEAHFIADIDGDFPETFDGNLFVMLVMAVDDQEDICDQSGQHLDHQSILAP